LPKKKEVDVLLLRLKKNLDLIFVLSSSCREHSSRLTKVEGQSSKL